MRGDHTPEDARRRLVQGAFDAGLEAVDPEQAVAAHLDTRPDLVASDAVNILAIGKAAHAMARGAAASLAGRVRNVLIVSDHSEDTQIGWTSIEGDHPIPGERSVAAAFAAIRFARDASGFLLVLVSGGGSALVEMPVPGVSLEDLETTQGILTDAAVPIHEMNCVRRHLSITKNGGIARMASCPIATLVVSDVIHGPASDVASGPTLPDESRCTDALGVLEYHGLMKAVPPSVVEFLATAAPPPPARAGPAEVVADGEAAAVAAANFGVRTGTAAEVDTTELSGEAADEATALIDRCTASGLHIAAGETTVHLPVHGCGGRNQEAALAGALRIAGTDMVFLAAGTDGRDGPTDAAGAMVDGETVARGRRAGLDPRRHLAGHDAYEFLDAAGDLIRSGPTGTNVGDLWILLRP